MDNNNNMVAAAPVVEKNGAKKGNGLMIATVLFGISTIALGTTLAVKMMNDESGNGGIENKTGNKCIVTQGDIDNPAEGTVAEVVANFDEDKEVKNIIEAIKKAANKENLWSITKTFDTDTVWIKLDNGMYTATTKSYGIQTDWNNAKIESYRKVAEDYLKNNGFELNNEFTRESMDVTYDKDNIRCNLKINSNIFSMGCANTSWISSEKEELINGLSSALKANEPDLGDKTFITVDMDNLETSEDGQYETIWANVGSMEGVGGAAALFYRSVESDEWKHVTMTQNVPECSIFDGDAVKAYEGTTCVEEDHMTLGTVGE